VFSLLGKVDADLGQPRAYLIRTATHLWIDRMRRRERESAYLESERRGVRATGRGSGPRPDQGAEVREAAGALLAELAPRERAAVLLRDVFDLSAEETATLLKTSVGAVKAALHRGRGRLANAERDTPAGTPAPPPDVVDRFIAALAAKDMDGLRALCSADLHIELVGGAEIDSFERGKVFFEHAHFVLPGIGLGESPRWERIVYDGEPMALGFRTLDGIEGVNEVHRLEVTNGKVTGIRCYCFAPDTLRVLGEHLGLPVLRRPYRSPG